MKDDLGNRMKEQYENRTRYYLPRRTYTVIRLDGKSFHKFTKHLEKPFDKMFMDIMDGVALYLAKNIQGCKLAYVQSDEISLVLTDLDHINIEAWFNGNIQKMCSVSASMTTREFNRLWITQRAIEHSGKYELENNRELAIDMLALNAECFRLAEFDSRVFTIPDWIEVVNYLIWRQKDATRNSINMVAQSLYSHKELQGKNCNQMQEMIFQKGINWNDYPSREKRGGLIVKEDVEFGISRKWQIVDCPIFTEDKCWDWLSTVIPQPRVY